MTASEFTSAPLGKYIIISKHPHSCSWQMTGYHVSGLLLIIERNFGGFNRCMFLLCVLTFS